MSKDLALFNFGSKEVRVVTREGEPLFVTQDVATILGFRDSHDLNRLLDEDEKADPHNVRVSSATGVVQGRSFDLINESGLYHAVFASRKPEAKAFRRWVTSEVLPSIRKTGTYSQDRWVDFAEYCNLVRKRISSRSKTLTSVPHAVRHALIIARADPAMGDAMVFGDGGALWVREDRLSTAFCMSAAKDGQVNRHHFEAVREAEEYSVLTKAEVLAKSGAQQPVNKYTNTEGLENGNSRY